MSLLRFFGFTEPSALAAYGPSHDVYYESLGRPTTSGIRVDEYRAFNYSVCWAATRLLAGTAGWLPFNLYKRLPAGGAEIDKEHRVHRIIHDQPNDDMGAMMFRSRGVNHQVNWGNTFAEIVRTVGGQPGSLEPIHPLRIPPQNIKREEGRIVYYVNRPDGMGPPQRVKQEDMFHVPSIISDDGIIGKGVVTAAREAIGKAIGTQIHGASAMNHGGAPPIALKGAKFREKKDQEDFRRQLKELHSGPQNAGEWLLLPKDTEVQMLGFNLKDSQFIESQQFDIEEVSRWYGVPPHLVGHLLRATFNNIEELGVSFVKYSLIQWLKLWEQEVWRKLLTKAEQKTHYAKFVVDALERGNLQTRTEAGVKKFFNGLWTLNDWAEQEDLNPITETVEIDGQQVSLGEMRFVQQAMVPLAMAAKGEQPKGPAEPPPKETPAPEPKEEVKESERDLAAIIGDMLAGNQQATERLLGDLRQDFTPEPEPVHRDWREEVRELRRARGLPDVDVDEHYWGHPPDRDEDGEYIVERLGVNGQRLANMAASISAIPHGLNGEAQELRDQLAKANDMQRKLASAMFRDVMSRMISLEVNAVKRVAEKPNRFDVRLREFYDKHRATLQRELAQPLAVYRACGGEVPDSFAEDHIGESLRQLDAVLDTRCTAEELPGKVEECVNKWHEERTVTS